MDVNISGIKGYHPDPVRMKDLIIDKKEIRAILSLGIRGEIPVPDQKHQVDILV